MEHIRNFYKVSDTLACSGQPTEEQLKSIAAQQYQVIVNLGLSGADYSLADETASVTNLGMSYLQVPVVFDNPEVSDLKTFIQYMDSQAGKKTLVHCALNYRGTCFTGLYLYYQSVINEDEMRDMICNIWQPNPIWELFLEDGIAYIDELRNA